MFTARPCDKAGNFLRNPTAPPPAHGEAEDCFPFEDRASFEWAELLFEEMGASRENIEKLLKIEAAKRAAQDGTDGTDGAFYTNADDLYETIDSIPYGDASWRTFTISYTGPLAPDAPWKHEKYVVHTRDALTVLENMANCPEFDGSWEYVPYEKYIGQNNREFRNFMSGRFAYKQAVSQAIPRFYVQVLNTVSRLLSPKTYARTARCSTQLF